MLNLALLVGQLGDIAGANAERLNDLDIDFHCSTYNVQNVGLAMYGYVSIGISSS